MPIKSSLGALRQQLPTAGGGLATNYWINLTGGNNIAASTFDGLGHLHFTSASNRVVSLDDRDTTISTDLLTGSFLANTVGAMASSSNNHTLAVGFTGTSLARATGFVRITNGNVANGGFSYSSSNTNLVLGNVTIDNQDNYIFCGRGTTNALGGRYGLIAKLNSSLAVQYSIDVRFPAIVFPSQDFNVIVNDAISDGSNTYAVGEYVGVSGAPGNGFLLKLTSVGALSYAKRLGYAAKKISLDTVGNSIIIGGQQLTGNTIGYVNKYSLTGNIIAGISIDNNLYANTGTGVDALSVDNSGNILIGGSYLKVAGSPNKANGYLIGLTNNLALRYRKEISSSMSGTPSLSIVDVESQYNSNSLYITASNTNLVTFNGLILKVPYDGTSPGTGNYTVGTTPVSYFDTTDVSIAPVSFTSPASNVFIQTSTTGQAGVSAIMTANTLPITKQFI